jgi:type IX secretion system PorP/SprF family membrane protein
MKTKHFAFGILYILTTWIIRAQQDTNYSFYNYNMNLVNPAYAGVDQQTKLGLNLRSQWASVQGAPETQSLFFGMPVGNNLGVGVSLINDKTFVEDQLNINADFSYKLQLGDAHEIYFGLKAGIHSYDVNTDGLQVYDVVPDPSLTDLSGRLTPNVGVGALLKHDDYFLSFSVPKLLKPDRVEFQDGQARMGIDRIHMYLSAGYEFYLGPALTLRPTTMLRHVENAPLSVDLTPVLQIHEKFDLGISYRWDESMALLFVFKTDWLQAGYAYESAFESPVRNAENGTHELLFNITF